jgi:hypothetical protein
MSLPVYSRADLSRILELVVAPSLPAVTTSAVAWEIRNADTRSENGPAVQALRHVGCLIAEPRAGRRRIRVLQSRRRADRRKGARLTIAADFERGPFEAAMTGIDAKAQRYPATAELAGLSRKVE